MPDNLELNFRELAKNATQYVFASTFPSLQRLLKTIQTTSEENRNEVENLDDTVAGINRSLTDINAGLRRLSSSVSKSLGILGRILSAAQEQSSGGGNVIPNVPPGLAGGSSAFGNTLANRALSNIGKTATAVGGTMAATSIIGSMYTPTAEETAAPSQQNTSPSGAMPSASVAATQPAPQAASGGISGASGGGSPPPSGATPAGSATPPPPSGAAATPEPKEPESSGSEMVIKAKTITFDAQEIVFPGGGAGGASMGGGGGFGGGGAGAPMMSGGGGGGMASASPMSGEASPSQGAGVTGDNGRLNPSELIGIDRGHRLEPTAARAYMSMVQAAAQEGISWGITDSYRDYPTQVRLAREKGLYSQGGLAATPGKSNHGWGRAVDLNLKGKAQGWIQQNAKNFGFSTIPREPWHWEYKGGGGGGTMMAGGGDKAKQSGEGAPAGGGQVAQGSEPPATPVSKGSATPSAGGSMVEKPAAKSEMASRDTAPKPTVATGATLNKESTNSEMASVTPPSRATMNNIQGGQQGGGAGVGMSQNSKLMNSNVAGNVEPEDAAQRYEALFGIKPKVPTGSNSKAA